MMFSSFEIAILNVSLKTKQSKEDQMEARMLELDQMEAGISINKKLKATVKEDKFTEGEIEFSTEEKALLLKLIERKWGVDDAEVYFSVKVKLS